MHPDKELIANLNGPHEWGYRDPVEGGFIEDNAPFRAADRLEALSGGGNERQARADRLQDSAYAAGLTAGWNFAQDNDNDGLIRAKEQRLVGHRDAIEQAKIMDGALSGGEAVAWRMVQPDGSTLKVQDQPFHTGFAEMMARDCGSEVQPLYASPIREPEISKATLIKVMRQHIKADATGLAPAVISHYIVGFEEAADAILNLAPVAKGASQDAELSDEFDRPGRLSDATRHSAEGAADPALSGTRGVVTPVGGRGEEGSARADLSPASRSPDQHSAGWRCRRCGRDEIDCQENGCPRGPCPMEFVG